jgi:hypothetical protein
MTMRGPFQFSDVQRALHPPASGDATGPAGAQAAEALRQLAGAGVLSGHAEKISARIDDGLLAAAARKLGTENITQVLQAALAVFVAPDPFVIWFCTEANKLPHDFEPAI